MGIIVRFFLTLCFFPLLATAAEMDIPLGYAELCKRSLHFCTADMRIKRSSPPIKYSKEVQSLLHEVNNRWNQRIRPISDFDLYKKIEVWTGSTTEGDCEEYAIAKKMDLLQLGFTASQLLYAHVIDQNNAGHLVLVVRTTAGNFVLDNMQADIVLWEKAGYPLHSRQRQDMPTAWTNDNFN